MKKRFLVLATLVVGLGLAACSVDTSGLEDAANDLEQQMEEASDKLDEEMDKVDEEVDKAEDGATTSTVMYQCPDDCQNGPAFFKEGPCKGCGKEMVEI